MIGKICFFCLQTICNHLVMFGSRDNKFNRSFIGNMIITWQPVVCAVGPIIRKESSMTKHVLADDQTVCRYTFVNNGVNTFSVCRSSIIDNEMLCILSKI